MNACRNEILFAGSLLLSAMSGLTGCMGSDAKPGEEKTVGEQTRQVSGLMEKHYPLNEQGEILAEIHPVLLASMKESLRSQAKPAAAADLEELYDPATGKLRDAAKLPEIQQAADRLSNSLSNAGAR